MKSWEIEKMFNQDNSLKKRIGSNVHRRAGKGSDRAGVAGGVRFATTKFKAYQKNSKVETSNMFSDIIKLKQFSSYDREWQQLLLIEWRKRYSNEKIRKEMGVSLAYYNSLIDELRVKEIEEEENGMLSPEEMEQAKENVIPYHEFKLLPDYQKFELVDHYKQEHGLTAKKLSEKWDKAVAEGTISTKKSAWRKAYKEHKKEEEELNSEIETDDTTEEEQPSNEDLMYLVGNSQESDQEQEVDKVSQISEASEKVFADVVPHEDDRCSLTVNTEYTGHELIQKLLSISQLVESTRNYNVYMKIEETSRIQHKSIDLAAEISRLLEEKGY